MQTEAMAALRGLEKAAFWGMPKIILETDAANLRCAITSEAWDNSPGGCLFKHIREFLAENFIDFVVMACPRECNRVADGLASHGCSALPEGEPMFWCSTPHVVSDLVSGDTPEVFG